MRNFFYVLTQFEISKNELIHKVNKKLINEVVFEVG